MYVHVCKKAIGGIVTQQHTHTYFINDYTIIINRYTCTCIIFHMYMYIYLYMHYILHIIIMYRNLGNFQVKKFYVLNFHVELIS